MFCITGAPVLNSDTNVSKSRYQYCIEMLYNCSNKHPSRNYKKEYSMSHMQSAGHCTFLYNHIMSALNAIIHYNYSAASDFADGESWGYRRFYELAKLVSFFHSLQSYITHHKILCSTVHYYIVMLVVMQEDDGYLREDTVVLRFSVRALTSHQKCRDLSSHIRRLEHKVEGLQRVSEN